MSILVKKVRIKSILNAMDKKDILLRMNFTQPYISFLSQEGIGGRLTSRIGVMEWTKQVLVRFKEPSKQASKFGIAGRAFCKLWGPLTNALHHGAGESELVVLKAIYKEFLPPNKDLDDYNKYPTTVVELLSIHAELCKFHNTIFTKNIWSTLHIGSKKAKAKKRSPVHISCQK
ncbi:hypothetical protein Cgig2_026999 [Carnegiea gigantea]|uniref:Uncharacterized protein n=1 Tax=Carnegiea gigantea TaxID=171969 RepID=A0A9Q1JW30_9CARY|nr:hypothetical protein Cgig2_026999 [Carnegiea gigantea]